MDVEEVLAGDVAVDELAEVILVEDDLQLSQGSGELARHR
tara:strand:- start:380 stop:499 length:120 start_codon:yes stop_codon:yes gene_type:complete